MERDNGNSKNTKVLIICFIMVFLGAIIFIGFSFFNLGHRLKILSYTPVSSYEDLKAISENPEGKYRLTKDIDMDGIEWVPFSFNGILDGDGHTISNLSVTETGTSTRYTYDGNMKCYSTSFAGMFDVIEGATISNISFNSMHIEVESDIPCFAGTIAGYMADSTIYNCSVNGYTYLRAHDRMFGVGGVAGYGYGTVKNVETNSILICVDTDSLTKDEQFMGGIVGAGYPDLINCRVHIEGYDSEHGYAHNGGAIGMYIIYPDSTEHSGQVTGNYIEGQIIFFEDNEDRRAYCSELIGEQMSYIDRIENNYASFQRREVYNYDVDLLPEECSTVVQYNAEESGYYDLNIEYDNQCETSSYGLFVNDRFYKKIYFPKGSGTVTDTVFMEEGSNNLKFKMLPGDGNISVRGVELNKSDKSVILIIAPHQDDEILAFAGIIQKNIEEGNIVKVLFLTNGDYFGTDFTSMRMAESINALSIIGVDKSNITMLGYGDHLIAEMLTTENSDEILQARSGMHTTYDASSLNIFDYHFMNFGKAADYTADNIKADLADYITVSRPERIYTTSEYEWHTDHQYAFYLTRDILLSLSDSIDYHPTLCETVIHGEDYSWPEHVLYDTDGSIVATEFTNPFPTMETNLDWDKAVRITLTNEELNKKKDAIDCFVSQNEDCEFYEGQKEYNYSFCKRDEFFWEIQF